MDFALLAFFGALASLAVWATWADEDLRWVGLMLAIGFGLSNAMFFAGVPVQVWPGPYTMIEVLVALTAYVAWGSTGYRALIVLVGFNLASVGANLVFAAQGFYPSRWEMLVFVVATNVCFMAECLLALGVGIAHGYRVGRFNWRFPFPGRTLQPDVAREGEAPWT